MIVVTELKKNSQKVVMFNLFHVHVNHEGFISGRNDANTYCKSSQNFCSIPQKWERKSLGSLAAGL